MELLDIGEVAARSGLQPSTLRHYEGIGLIAAVARHGLRRQFAPEVLFQLKLISMGKRAGFSLEELAGILGHSARPDFPRPVLQEKANEIDQQIHQLTILRDTLRHVVECPAPSHLECSSFRRLLETADECAGKRRKRIGKVKAKRQD